MHSFASLARGVWQKYKATVGHAGGCCLQQRSCQEASRAIFPGLAAQAPLLQAQLLWERWQLDEGGGGTLLAGRLTSPHSAALPQGFIARPVQLLVPCI
jgi:hypothetical protein